MVFSYFTRIQMIKVMGERLKVVFLFNPLAAELYLLPFIGHEGNFLQTFTWHGLSFSIFTVWHSLFSLVLVFPVLRIEAPPHPQYRVSVYTLSVRPMFRTSVPEQSNREDQFIGQTCLSDKIFGPIYRQVATKGLKYS